MIIYWNTLEKDAADTSTIPQYISSEYMASVHFARNIYWETQNQKSGSTVKIVDYIYSEVPKWFPYIPLVTKAYLQAYRISSFTVTNYGQWYDVDLDGGDNNKLNITHSTSTDPSRITILSSGVYKITYTVSFGMAGGVTLLQARLLINNNTEVVGSFIEGLNVQGDRSQTMSHTVITSLNKDDYFTLQILGSNAGGTKLFVFSYYPPTIMNVALVTIERLDV